MTVSKTYKLGINNWSSAEGPAFLIASRVFLSLFLYFFIQIHQKRMYSKQKVVHVSTAKQKSELQNLVL